MEAESRRGLYEIDVADIVKQAEKHGAKLFVEIAPTGVEIRLKRNGSTVKMPANLNSFIGGRYINIYPHDSMEALLQQLLHWLDHPDIYHKEGWWFLQEDPKNPQ